MIINPVNSIIENPVNSTVRVLNLLLNDYKSSEFYGSSFEFVIE